MSHSRIIDKNVKGAARELGHLLSAGLDAIFLGNVELEARHAFLSELCQHGRVACRGDDVQASRKVRLKILDAMTAICILLSWPATAGGNGIPRA